MVFKLLVFCNCTTSNENWENVVNPPRAPVSTKTLIIEDYDRILGYLMSRSIFEEHHILNIGVFPPRQKEGIGTKLLSSFLKSTKSSSSVFLEVKKSNFHAIKLYKNFINQNPIKSGAIIDLRINNRLILKNE